MSIPIHPHPPVLEFQGEFRFLSNFYDSPITVYGLEFPTVEHAFVASKTTDPTLRAFIAHDVPTPGQAKRKGRAFKLRDDWDELRIPIMTALITLKFAPGTQLAHNLLATQDAILCEGNSWGDRFWGVDMEGRGANHLGTILMLRREQLTPATAFA